MTTDQSSRSRGTLGRSWRAPQQVLYPNLSIHVLVVEMNVNKEKITGRRKLEVFDNCGLTLLQFDGTQPV